MFILWQGKLNIDHVHIILLVIFCISLVDFSKVCYKMAFYSIDKRDTYIYTRCSTKLNPCFLVNLGTFVILEQIFQVMQYVFIVCDFNIVCVLYRKL